MIEKGWLSEANKTLSPNKGGTLKKPSYLVIHFTAGRSLENSTRWLCTPAAKASAHLIIGRDGNINQLVPFDTMAWHAGDSKWKGLVGMNKYSIGIELDNVGPLMKTADGLYRSPTLGIEVPASNVVEAEHKNQPCSYKYWQTYTPVQLRALEAVCGEIVKEYPTIVDCVGHDDIAPGRKVDVGPAMDMSHLRSVVFGRA